MALTKDQISSRLKLVNYFNFPFVILGKADITKVSDGSLQRYCYEYLCKDSDDMLEKFENCDDLIIFVKNIVVKCLFCGYCGEPNMIVDKPNQFVQKLVPLCSQCSRLTDDPKLFMDLMFSIYDRSTRSIRYPKCCTGKYEFPKPIVIINRIVNDKFERYGHLTDYSHTNDVRRYIDKIIDNIKARKCIVEQKSLWKFCKLVTNATGDVVNNEGKSDNRINCNFSIYIYMAKRLSPYMLNLNIWDKRYFSYFEKYVVASAKKCTSFDKVLCFLQDLDKGKFVELDWGKYDDVMEILKKYDFLTE